MMKKIIKALFLKQRDNKYAKIVTGYNNKEKEKGYSMKEQDLRLEYQQAARNWEDVLPLGNGSLGAMVWGGAEKEIIGLNQETLWSGYVRDKNDPAVLNYLPEVRRLLLAEKYEEAQQMTEKHLLGEYGESYLPFGNLVLTFPNQTTQKYTRSLDLATAIAKVESGQDQDKLTREYFVSYPHDALFIKITGQQFQCAIAFESKLNPQVRYTPNKIQITGQCPEHVDPNYIPTRPESFIQGTKGQHYTGEIAIYTTDGQVEVMDNQLFVTKASTLVLQVSLIRPAKNTKEQTYEAIKQAHMADYQALFATVAIGFGQKVALPTDQRLARLKTGAQDPSLYALYFQYGRYLLIASSREGSLPANLQGIWSWEVRAPWSSNWTTNINLPMNYWLAQTCHLEACLPPYFDWLKKLVVEGKKTARINYGMQGFVAHHNVDYWMNTNPVGRPFGKKAGETGSAMWAMWPMGGLWLSQELFRHYQYHLDEKFLKETAYPILKEACLFILDWLVEIDGTYHSLPSTSPENRFQVTKDSPPCAVTKDSALDLQLIEELFINFTKTCQILKLNDSLLQSITQVQARLAKVQIGQKGQILEWDKEFIESEPGHRHFSHLYGLFPGENFDSDETLINASKVSLEECLNGELAHHTTGWSCAWIINFYSILQDKTNTGKYLKKMLVDSTLDNLWGVHPPFQIDANFGGTAGIANALVNERLGQLNLLPALPDFLPNGYVKGLRLTGKRTIDLSWEDGKLTTYQIYLMSTD